MKRVFILTGLAILIASFFILKPEIRQRKNENNQWHQEYLAKQKMHKEGVKGTKAMRIGEIDKHFKEIRTKFGESDSRYPADYLMKELRKAQKNRINFKDVNSVLWVHRGPGNVGGRTRAVVVDASDPTYNTWFAGSATGGAWKTTDGGQSWENLSTDIPYHAIPTIVQSATHAEVLFIGTGESFPGSLGTTGGGVFKSSDKGITWNQLLATAGNEDFRYVNRLLLHPSDTSLLLAATTTGVFKTIDGGVTWDKVYNSLTSVEDIKANPQDFNIQYAGVNGLGIIRSSDGGTSWELASNGIFGNNGRFEIAISPTNPEKVFLSVENGERGSDVYLSLNAGDTWNVVQNTGAAAIDYLGGQAGYDNTIAVHPYSDDTVFVGGVNCWKVAVTDSLVKGEGTIVNFDTVNTASFLEFIDFSGIYPGISTGDQEEGIDLVPSDFVDVEIRFGPGLSQKAHRFKVPDEATSGVPAADYAYIDYVEVPFEVWDVSNNIQLMCSFRDQEQDGVFNLYERTGDEYGQLGREYIFVNSIPYNDAAPDANIAVQGGRSYKLTYFLWPILAEGGVWDPNNLPDSKIVIDYEFPDYIKGQVLNVSDAYQQYSGRNSYDQESGRGNTTIPGFHPDHHALTIVPVNEAEKKFWIVNGNDGGLGISKDNGFSFEQITNGYVTTQFYGVAKKPYRNEYFGGMQDNGTWQSPLYKDAELTDDYFFRLGGDGFEAVWHAKDTNLMLGSIYNNDIYRSKNHGVSWVGAAGGIDGDGPFVTKLTMIPSNPNRVYAIGSAGLYYTRDFGTTAWISKSMPTGWVPEGFGVSSSHQIKYSIANDSILWAGAALSEEFGWKIFVSTNAGSSFTAVNYPNPAKDAFVSNIATHPTEPQTAYLIYSLFGEGKILRTEDLGQTWEDITGFDTDSTSNNGFPDVGCLSLLVFPDNPQRIWAGTEIGIMESLDNGVSWNMLESNLPTVPIYQLFAQDNQVVAGTYGRGIWTYQYGPVVEPPKDTTGTSSQIKIIDKEISLFPNPTSGSFQVELGSDYNSSKVEIVVYDLSGRKVSEYLSSGKKTISIDFENKEKGNYIVTIHNGNNTISKRLVVR